MISPPETAPAATDVTETPALLTARGLRISTRAGGRTLLAGIDLQVRAGETVGIVGESGSGKSLTARALIGLPPPGIQVEGSIRYRGAELTSLSERQRSRTRGTQIGLVLQDPFTSLSPLRRCGQHIGEMLRDPSGRRLSRAARHAEAVRRLAEVGITDPAVADRYPFELSGGMRQRVAIAASLARNPDLLIADEPSTALDTVVQAEILDLLAQVQRQRAMSLILITHDLRIAFSLCDRVYVLYAGQVVEVGPARSLAERPLHPYTHALLGADPPLHQRVEHLANIPGGVPAAEDVLDRCPFAARCRFATDDCLRPVSLAQAEPDRWSACVRLPDLRADLAVPAHLTEGPAADLVTDEGADRHRDSTTGAASVDTGEETADEPAGDGPASGPLVRITGLSRRFVLGRRRVAVALDGVDMTIGAGESVGLVGASGSGKTTLSRILVGLDTPSGGSVRIGGIDASDYSRLGQDQQRRLRRSVQYIFQDPYSSLNPALSIRTTLSEAVALRHGRAGVTRERLAGLLSQVGLPARYLSLKPVALSGGERQRIAIARALAIEPDLVVCDEPVSALDVSVQAHILNLLRDLHEQTGVAYLFITHDLAVVRQMVDRLYVLNEGHIVEQGTTSAVLDRPQHPYTRELLAAVPGEQRITPDAAAPD